MAINRLDQAKLLVAEMEEQARLQSEINSSLSSYIDHVEKVKDLKESINVYEKNIKKVQDEIDTLANSTLQADKERVAVLKLTVDELNKSANAIKQQHKLMVKAVKEAKSFKMFTAEAVVGTAKMLGNLDKLPGKFQNLMAPLKDLFEMDKAIRKASLQMGLIGGQSANFRSNIKLAAEDTQKLGMGIKELAEMQAQYSENIGRNVSLGKEGLVALAQIAEGTGLGAEATGQMAADFEAQGVSAIRTKDAMEEAANRASSMGLNSAKVVKNIAQNTKMLNKFRFKDGVKGLVKMAEVSAKLGVDMEFASGFAEKLWNVEGAVETAAQFNVMGGAFARLGDPFKLMYMARNDIAGLTEEIGKAAAESATFNKQTGKFELGAMEMHRLKIIAEQTGLEYDKLATAGLNAAKFTKIKSQVSFGMDDEGKEFLANTAQLDKDGKAYIVVKGEKKLLSTLGASGTKLIQDQVKEKKTLEERALAAKGFDEQITNLINMVKIYMMPIVEGLTEVLKPFVEDLMGEKGKAFKDELKSLGVQIGSFISTAATWFKGIGEIAVALGPKGIFYAWLAGKGVMALFDVAKWVLNGLSLSQGFLMGTRGMSAMGAGAGAGAMGSTVGKNSSWAPGQVGKPGFGSNFKTSMRSGGTIAGGVIAGGLTGYNEYGEQRQKGKSEGEAAGRAVLKGAGAGGGAMAGMAAGAAIGAAFGGVGAIPGALLGLALGSLGAYAGGELTDLDNYGVKDGLFKGSSSMKNRRAILQNGKITPIDKKDDLLALKKYGLAENSMRESSFSNNRSNKVEFGNINITGEIKITMPDGTNIGRELLKSPEFKASITRVVTTQLDKNINGGKIKP
jgi:hypothetical protein